MYKPNPAQIIKESLLDTKAVGLKRQALINALI